jgi:ubiquinone/menaquinone biosynthesis C-methylase UbiE
MSKLGEVTLKLINPLFKKQVHPFNLQLEKEMTYAEWEFEKGEDTIKFYLDKFTTDEMFKDKEVIDFGCGAGGKSIYYASLGAKHVTGVDIVEHYEKDSKEFAKQKGYEDRFTFKIADATKLPFKDNSFDTAIMNDFMEHVNKPEEALKEALRVLKPNGRIYLNFPPYSHPFGAHLSDAINMPWCHLFFSEKTCINVYKDLVKDLSDGEDRIKFRFSKNEKGKEYISYINKMTIKRFNKILKKLDITPYYYKMTPFAGFVKPFAKIPGLREILNKNVVCVIQK